MKLDKPLHDSFALPLSKIFLSFVRPGARFITLHIFLVMGKRPRYEAKSTRRGYFAIC
jgi:hypothetical protein